MSSLWKFRPENISVFKFIDRSSSSIYVSYLETTQPFQFLFSTETALIIIKRRETVNCERGCVKSFAFNSVFHRKSLPIKGKFFGNAFKNDDSAKKYDSMKFWTFGFFGWFVVLFLNSFFFVNLRAVFVYTLWFFFESLFFSKNINESNSTIQW